MRAHAALRIRRGDVVGMLRAPLPRACDRAAPAPAVEPIAHLRIRRERRGALPSPAVRTSPTSSGARAHQRASAHRAWRFRGRPRPLRAARGRPQTSQRALRRAARAAAHQSRSRSSASARRSVSPAARASTISWKPLAYGMARPRSIRETVSRGTDARRASSACVSPRARRTMRIACSGVISGAHERPRATLRAVGARKKMKMRLSFAESCQALTRSFASKIRPTPCHPTNHEEGRAASAGHRCPDSRTPRP